MGPSKGSVESVCVFCGASNAANPEFISAAAEFGKLLASSNLRMVYGGGGVGLMGACAKAAHESGGRVLGVMPNFLRAREILYDEVETIVVRSMHERKKIMFDQSDAFVVLPGGIGTLEEIVELLSWRRLALHAKPIVFFNQNGFWERFYDLMNFTVEQRLTPPQFLDTFRSVDTIEEILPMVMSMAATAPEQDAVPRAVQLT